MKAHRVQPQMMEIMPNHVRGCGGVEKASRVFLRKELMPLQKRLLELNGWLSEEVLRFEPYTIDIPCELYKTVDRIKRGVSPFTVKHAK